MSTYGKSGKIPVIRSSICTGEQVAGFKDPVSDKFDVSILDGYKAGVNMLG